MIIVETTFFTRQVVNLLPDDNYRFLQITLANHPNIGDLIKGSGGIRKIRWAGPRQTWGRTCHLLLGRSARSNSDAFHVSKERTGGFDCKSN
jgi:hypothetical protein